MTIDNRALDLAEFKRRLGGANGREYWRTLDELADSEAFNQYMQDEFPRHADAAESAVDRRDFLKVMSASLAMTGLAACAPPTEKILPYVKMPEEIVPGKPLFFATAMTLGGVATGVLVESHMGRPTKIEGNPEHPASLGATDPFAQASILNLYDPERSQTVRYVGNVSTWNDFLGALQLQLAKQRDNAGAGLRILTETVTSPTIGAQMKAILERYP
ncbi:MAG TPA: TAT-variant-translocated molybdopterin oxidoreductase, partial [Thermoanaerobaculia bacterium]